ncbi:SUKH-4 family immunity protein [Actinopolymorpha sp. B9G3]|uniref:SUKH-4 family immunity protein n=1 Tax=Actinopolymorpha sp. B9G3 TaxID=3158970 RepID=UPI0032D90835
MDGTPACRLLGEVRRLWGDRLALVPTEHLRDNMPEDVRLFLAQVGLPVRSPTLVTFRDNDRLGELISAGEAEFSALADEAEATLGIKSGTHQIWAVHPEGLLPQRFVNSDLPRFLLFLAHFDDHLPDLRDADNQQEARALTGQLRRLFTVTDPIALTDPESWWSLVLEQADEGFM